ncbi:anti-sigma factor [Streptomyces sp. SPB4]|uniref:anti-sigma factor n=1 Tax=Streptomyces sp. SPB4 TaxID=2940553 RepID=UPI002475CD13|nr:anti-sigma factor [Streptomyces sp. SPB4]MDH6537668.1 anti-sigma factor RsiW [Streptomyces sp. SPB4]
MGTENPHEATAAYVLDALAEPERAAFEAHLETCPDCAREVREFAATAALLGTAVAVEPPPALRGAVLRRIRELPAGTEPEPGAARRPDPEAGPWAGPGAGPETGATRGPGPETGAARHRAPRGRGWARWALAACLAVAAGLGGVAAWQYQRADTAREQARAAEAREAALAGVLSAPDARLASGRIPDGGTGTVVVSRERDRAVFVPSGMAAPPAGRVYQLWFAGPGGMRPAGLMDPARPGAPALLAGPVGAATGIGVTVEPEGGSAAPTTAPLVLLALPGARTA